MKVSEIQSILGKLGIKPSLVTPNTQLTGQDEPPAFTKPEERKVAQMVWDEIRRLTNQPQKLPSVTHLQKPEVQAAIVKAVEQRQPSPEFVPDRQYLRCRQKLLCRCRLASAKTHR